ATATRLPALAAWIAARWPAGPEPITIKSKVCMRSDSVYSSVGEQAVVRVVIRAEKWVYGGGSLARLDGRGVVGPFLVPVEEARVELPRSGVDARLVELLAPAPERVAAPCPIFGRCGGCHYQHAPYEFQLARKVEILREQLRRVGKLDYTGEVAIVSAHPFG